MRVQRFLAALSVALVTGSVLAGSGIWSSSGPWGGRVLDFDIDPSAATTAYATTSAGLFKTVDGGLSWARSDRGIPAGIFTPLGVLLDRDAPDTLYAFDEAGRLFRSEDGATNWSATGHTLPAVLSPTDWDDVPGSTGTFYVTFSDSTPTSTGTLVLRTTDAGATFAVPGTGLPADREFYTITVDPDDGARAVAGLEFYDMATSGVPAEPSLYRTVDGGATWAPVLTFPTNDFVQRASDVAFGAGATVYSIVGLRVFRSDDDGATWAGPLANATLAISNLFAHPTVASTVFIGSGNGMFRSTDSGATTTLVAGGLTPNATYTHVNPPNVPVPADVKRIVAEPGFPAAGLWVATDGGGLFRSTDGGATWSGNGVNEGLGGVNIRTLTVHPNPSTHAVGGPGKRIYAGLGDASRSSQPLFVTTNGTLTWNALSSGLRAGQLRSIVIDPTTAGVTAQDVSSSTLFAAGRGASITGYRNAGVYRSTNGGTTWASIDSGLPTRTLGGVTATDVGLARQITLDPRSCTLPPTGPCANGPLRRLYVTADGYQPPDPMIPNRFNATHRIIRTDNADAATPTWTDVSASLPGATYELVCALVECNYPLDGIRPLPLVISPEDSNVLYVGTFAIGRSTMAPDMQNGVFKSTDAGATWQHMSNGLPRKPGRTDNALDVLAMAIHPTDGDILWVTVIDLLDGNGASIYKTTDGGASWFESSSGISARVDLRALLVDPQDPDTLYASGSGTEADPGAVYKSEDGGATWRSISIGLPFDSALSLALDPFVPTVLHAGTLSGVWSIEQVPDADGDGVPDATENNAPNGGDGNGDGSQDSTQSDVGSSVVILRPGPRAPQQGAGGFFTSDIVAGTPSKPGGCTQAVDVQAQLAARHGRDYVDGTRTFFYAYPRDLVRFEILDCMQATVDITFHGADFAAQYGWTFRFYGPQTPGSVDSIAFHDFASRATRVAPNKWRLTLDANQFGSYRPRDDAILFEGGPACHDDRVFRAGFEDAATPPPSCI